MNKTQTLVEFVICLSAAAFDCNTPNQKIKRQGSLFSAVFKHATTVWRRRIISSRCINRCCVRSHQRVELCALCSKFLLVALKICVVKFTHTLEHIQTPYTHTHTLMQQCIKVSFNGFIWSILTLDDVHTDFSPLLYWCRHIVRVGVATLL